MSSNPLRDVFEFRAPLQTYFKYIDEGLVRVDFPGVKPYLSVATVERILSVIRGRCIAISTRGIAYWSRRLGVSETNLRRLIAQYVMSGLATIRENRACFDRRAVAVPVIVNNVTPGRRAGIRLGNVRDRDVLTALWYLHNNGIALYTSRGEFRITVMVAVTFYASWYTATLEWEDKKRKESPVESQVDVATTVWVDSFEKFRELHDNEAWVDQLFYIMRNARDYTDFFIFTFEVVSEKRGVVYPFELHGNGLMPLTREEGIRMLDEPYAYDQAILTVDYLGKTYKYRVYLGHPIYIYEEGARPVVVDAEKI